MYFFAPLFVIVSCLLGICILDTQKELTKDILEKNKNILNKKRGEKNDK